MSLAAAIKWNADGLVPAIVQDQVSGRVLMQAWMNAEALSRTRETGLATFWSRSRGSLWVKGETSGNTQRVRELRLDCDGDCLLLLVAPAGPACHTGELTCFFQRADEAGWQRDTPASSHVLDALAATLEGRKLADPGTSYVAGLYAAGRERIAQKLGEEAVEAVIAAVADDRSALTGELADLWFHSLILLADAGIAPDEVLSELARRQGVSGLIEKAARGHGEN